METALTYLIVITICLSVLMSAGNTLVGLANAIAPLVLVVAVAVCIVRIVWHFTNHH